MSRVVKAAVTRILPPEIREEKDVPAAETPSPVEDTSALEQSQDDAYQAAYDEVVQAAQEEVSLLIEDARKTARGIIEEADRQAETMREQARLEGMEQGRSEGYSGGFAQAGREMEELLRRGQAEVDTVLNQAYDTRNQLLSETEDKIYRLALDIARKILGYELDENNDAFLSVVKTAINAVQCESRVTLHVNTEEYINVFRSKDTASLRTDKGSITADILSDPSVEPGGCLIETENGIADASPSVQLEQIAFNMGLEDNP